MADKPIRVLVVDDAALHGRQLCDILAATSGLEVVDTAANDQEALRLIEHVHRQFGLDDLSEPIPKQSRKVLRETSSAPVGT